MKHCNTNKNLTSNLNATDASQGYGNPNLLSLPCHDIAQLAHPNQHAILQRCHMYKYERLYAMMIDHYEHTSMTHTKRTRHTSNHTEQNDQKNGQDIIRNPVQKPIQKTN